MNSPKWAREIERFASVKSQFVLWGNIYDVYPYNSQNGIVPLKLADYLKESLLEHRFALIVQYEPLIGFTYLGGDAEAFKVAANQTLDKQKSMQATLQKAAEIIELINRSKKPIAIVLNFASRLSEIAQNDVNEFYYRLFRLSHNAAPVLIDNKTLYNQILWIVEKENDLPDWYSLNNARIKSLPLPKPDNILRLVIIEALASRFSGYEELSDSAKAELKRDLVDQTNGFFAVELVAIFSLAMREGIRFEKTSEAVKAYKLGVVENEWSKIDVSKLLNAHKELEKRVKGQSFALNKSIDILKRAWFNLSGAQAGKGSNRPKGIMFFAGPTGVGKTELAKALTELIFGSGSAYIRFDMSEFSHDHANQRLIGAPPGYVGFDSGGELTNAMKQNPFAVVLFDEIEKAHPKIMDMFLQILDDGRLTSGRGETVYFSESLIIFTSNLGAHTQGGSVGRASAELPYEANSAVIREAIEEHFQSKLARPEILNRIGQNIVIFDYIRPKAASAILDKMINNVLTRVQEEFKIKVTIDAAAYSQLETICCADLSMGGRGIGNHLEEALINPLSRLLFERREADITIEKIESIEGRWVLAVK